jgi:DNA polymerase III delta prime subunit
MNGLGLPKRIENILETMLEFPEARSHLLLIGPPGSGKTTSARIFVQALHASTTKSSKSSFFGRALFLNSSDERGLEAVRGRVYPFIRSSFDSLFVSTGPKVIIFDEAETLTDQAQIALRPLLDMNPQKILIIFLCNSVSRIHTSIIHKFTVIPFEAPHLNDFKLRIDSIMGSEICNTMAGIDIQFRRGDIRFFLLNPGRYQDCAKFWHQCMTVHPSQLLAKIEQTLPKWVFLELAMFCLCIAKTTGTFTYEALQEMLRISDTDLLRSCSLKVRANLLTNWFDTHIRIKLEEISPT